jgi:signal transduction histidine kinase
MALAANTVASSDTPSIATAGLVLREEIQRLDRLARAFSQLGRPVEGPPSRVDLHELLASMARKFSSEGVALDLQAPSEPIEVMGHFEALERVARNLVANAFDAAAAQGAVEGEARVELRLSRASGGAEIRVLDRGPGIPPELLERIWEPEFTTKRRGTGLGLALVRQAILAHGGEVFAENRLGGGAEFRVWLPLGAPEMPDTPSTHPVSELNRTTPLGPEQGTS